MLYCNWKGFTIHKWWLKYSYYRCTIWITAIYDELRWKLYAKIPFLNTYLKLEFSLLEITKISHLKSLISERMHKTVQLLFTLLTEYFTGGVQCALQRKCLKGDYSRHNSYVHSWSCSAFCIIQGSVLTCKAPAGWSSLLKVIMLGCKYRKRRNWFRGSVFVDGRWIYYRFIDWLRGIGVGYKKWVKVRFYGCVFTLLLPLGQGSIWWV